MAVAAPSGGSLILSTRQVNHLPGPAPRRLVCTSHRMLARLESAAVFGVDAWPVHVEVDVGLGLPFFRMVGLPDASVRESRDRVRAAIRNCGFDFPAHRITINLAPADVRKAGSSFDLPIALGILAAEGIVPAEALANIVLVGELSLDGTIHGARGVLPIAAAARKRGAAGLLLPTHNAAEAAVVGGLRLLPVRTLTEAVSLLKLPLSSWPDVVPQKATVTPGPLADALLDLRDLRGQGVARRALEIAAAGAHNLLMIGSPGAGKTMLARRLPGILPSLSFDEALECTAIHSVAGTLPAGVGLLCERPFRAPHHTISDVALVGGGAIPRPGEISLAHQGVLFLDEMPEFSRHVLDVLRQPLEEGRITVARAARTVCFPARFLLVAAMNPCPCGYRGDPKKACRCTPPQVARYRGRLSGPLLDRIDLIVDVQPVAIADLTGTPNGEASAPVRARVLAARDRQLARPGRAARLNAALYGRAFERVCAIDEAGRRLLERSAERLHLTARGFHRVLKVARTIADLADERDIATEHLAEALQYRLLD
jgi:magnesium chelatase family protein